MRRPKNFLLAFLLLLMVAVGAFVAFIASNVDLGVEDSSALFGGRLEKGYPSAGYLINETADSVKTCGYSVITNQVAITAGHCVDDAKQIFLGTGQFSSNTDLLKPVRRAVAKANWVNAQVRSDDFAILTFPNSGFFDSFAKIGTPTDGCIARVVAYGRTEDPLESITKPRKSALLCVSDIGPETFRMTSEDAGICFGDSGSPIYREGTNEVIGIVVSIVKKNPNDTEPCAIGNTAIAVRVDANERLLQEQLQVDFSSTEILALPSETQLDVANETLLEQLGLSFIQNMDSRQRDTYLLAGVVGLLVIMLIAVGVLLSGGREQNHSSAYEGLTY